MGWDWKKTKSYFTEINFFAVEVLVSKLKNHIQGKCHQKEKGLPGGHCFDIKSTMESVETK